MKPPYQVTTQILEQIASIAEKIGEINAAYLYRPPTELRKKNRIKTIQSSLEIEGNSLSLDQVTAILDNKKVIAPKKDILEVKNTIKTYESLDSYDYTSLNSFCKAHATLMNGLIENAGKIRTKSVGILKGSKVTHIAPPGDIVKSSFKRQYYLRHFKDISTATASRDLKLAVDSGLLDKSGDKRTTSYNFKK
jgi:Fic family protein